MESPKFESDVVIGLEIHVELDTKTKLFCGCSTQSKAQGVEEPNTRCCEVCLGHPGSKPVLNKKAFEYGLKLGLALSCKISDQLIFSRKSYFYPDMSKNYQITQYEIPLGQEGTVKLSDGRKIRIKRIHLEEDPASLTHPQGMTESKYVLVNYNRSGNPLCEVVTEPDLKSPEDARDFMKQLISILEYLEIFDLKEGIIKADVNVSIKESGYIRVEIKNVTGFKEIELALKHEIERQKSDPSSIVQETRSWDAVTGKTKSMRKKEVEEEYGYIIDPDLVAIDITKDMIAKAKKEIPELPFDKAERFVNQYKISEIDAQVISADKELSHLFERIAKKANPQIAAKWLRRDLVKVLNIHEKTLTELNIDERYVIELFDLVEAKTITDSTAKELFEKLLIKPFSPKEHVEKSDIKAVNDEDKIHLWCAEAIDDNPQVLSDYLAGKEKAKQFFVGQIMKKSKGKANPEIANKILLEEISKRK